MCGIYGIARPTHRERLDSSHLERMARGIPAPARGDRAESVRWISGAAGMASAPHPGRLHGAASAEVGDATVALVLHGSLFPAPGTGRADARGSASARGILDGYLEEGTSVFERLRGDFAVAVWDGRDQSLLLAVDRFRIHSLVYAETPGGLLFASRLASLRASGLLPDEELLPESIVDVIGSSYIPTPRTIFRRVRKLPPGSWLRWREGATTVRPYWDVDFRHPDGASPAELQQRVRETFDDAIAVRYAADQDEGPLGAFLSGGVDSSTITGILARHGGSGVKSFSIGFGEARFNEMEFARIAARRFGVEHVEYFVTPADVVDTLPLLLDHFDEPFANASAVPTYQCARVARDHGVRVMYAGDGGDEFWGGNERYAIKAAYDPYLAIPRPIRAGLVRPLVGAIAAVAPISIAQRAKRYVARAEMSHAERMTAHAFLRVTPLQEVFDGGFLRSIDPGYAPYSMLAHYFDGAPAVHDLDRELYLDLKLAISDNDLFKVVRMTEAAGVSVRFPFLDGRLAELAMRVPARLKMRGAELRTFFKETYADLLPAEVRQKQKHGFGLPIPVWLRDDPTLREMMHDLVLGERLKQRGLFAPRALEELVRRHQTDTTSFYGTILWNVMILELWLRRWSARPA
jgi:asparagine synthase (glutamine-hydrolysing)